MQTSYLRVQTYHVYQVICWSLLGKPRGCQLGCTVIQFVTFRHLPFPQIRFKHLWLLSPSATGSTSCQHLPPRNPLCHDAVTSRSGCHITCERYNISCGRFTACFISDSCGSSQNLQEYIFTIRNIFVSVRGSLSTGRYDFTPKSAGGGDDDAFCHPVPASVRG